MNTMNNIKKNTLREVFFILFKHKWKIILLFLAVLAMTTVFIRVLTPSYSSHAKLFMRMGAERMQINPQVQNGQSLMVSQSFENKINSEVALLQSHELAEKVIASFQGDKNREKSVASLLAGDPGEGFFAKFVDKISDVIKPVTARWFGPQDTYPFDPDQQTMEALIQQLRSNLDAQVVTNSYVIAVSYKDTDPYRAQDILRRYIDAYLDEHLKVNASKGSYTFFKKESDKLLANLNMSEKRLEDFKNTINMGSIDDRQKILTSQIVELRKKIRDTDTYTAALRRTLSSGDLLSSYPDSLDTGNTVDIQTTDITKLRDQLYSLKFKEQELLSTYTKDSIPVNDIRREIKDNEVLLRNTMKGLLASLTEHAASFRQRLENTDTELKKINTAESTLAQYERQKDMLEGNYKKYAESLEQARIDNQLEKQKMSNIVVAESPTLPIQSDGPSSKIKLILGIILGITLGVGVAFFMEYLDNRLQEPEDVEGILELPVLGSVEKMRP